MINYDEIELDKMTLEEKEQSVREYIDSAFGILFECDKYVICEFLDECKGDEFKLNINTGEFSDVEYGRPLDRFIDDELKCFLSGKFLSKFMNYVMCGGNPDNW